MHLTVWMKLLTGKWMVTSTQMVLTVMGSTEKALNPRCDYRLLSINAFQTCWCYICVMPRKVSTLYKSWQAVILAIIMHFYHKLPTWQAQTNTTQGNLICILPFFLAEDESALKKSEVVNWYLKEIESEIDSEIELINKKTMIEKVIYRLVHYVRKHFHVI